MTARGVYELAGDLAQVGAGAVPALRTVMSDMGKALEEEWRENARETSGKAGKHYPNSIRSDLKFGVTSVTVEAYPDPHRDQGGMSFEFGSRNQPPHLGGLRAITSIAPRAERALDAAIGHLFP